MSDVRTVKKVFLGKPGGRIKASRPKLRWLDYWDWYEVGSCQDMEKEGRR